VAVGSTNTVTAQNVAGFDFQSWSDGGARSHLVVAPATPTTLTAQYRVLEGAVQLKHLGSVIARVQEPQGLGSHDLEVIRNDDRPPPGTVDGARQYDTFTTDLAPKDEWVGYELGAPHLFSRVVFQEGGSFPDGGWFEKIEVQVRKGGIWTPVEGVTVTPAYPGAGDGVWFDSYRFDFPPTSGDAIRLHGPAGGAAHFVSIGELDVFGRAVIPGQDLPPFAQAAGPDPVLAGEEVTLDGRGSSDPEGNALTFAWKQTGGPPVSLSDAASARPRFCAPDVKTATTLTFSLTVGDGKQSSAPVTLTLQLLPFLGPMDLTPRGRILISERLPRGLGSRDVEVIRDGITPAPGAQDWLAQYDTAAGDPGVTEGYVGYELDKAYRFSKLVFQEGGRFADGGWFDRLRVQVRQDGRWYEVPGLAVAPAYPASGGAAGFATYTFTFTPTVGDAIRLFGAPGGAMRFFSVAELRMFMAPPAGPNAPPVANAGRDFALPEGVQARLDGARSFDPDGRTITTKWRQTYGPRVSLADASSATPSFTAPEVSARTTLEFRLDVADDRSVAYDAVVVTVEPATAPRDVTAAGVVIASVRAPLGGGSRDLEILRDGVTPAAGTEDGSLQYDTFTATPASSAWFGYELDVARALGKIVFQEGLHFGDGGWFTSLAVQVRRDGSWAPVAGVVVSPSYPGANDGRGFDTYTLTFPPVVAEAIRIVGPPGGAATFVSVAELRVFMP
jgi:hypothetical protein